MYKYISSVQNSQIKDFLLLQEKSKYRNEQQLFVIDGWKETKMAIENNFSMHTIFFNEQIDIESLVNDLISENKKNIADAQLIKVSEAVFEKMAYRGSASKVVSIAQSKLANLQDIKQTKNPLFLVIDGIEKPGNLGAILRVADAANINAVFCSSLHTDIFNPNVIRSSVGCLFGQNIIVDTKENIFSFLRERNVTIFTTSLLASQNYLNCSYKDACAIVVGTESTGVDVFWEQNSSQNIIIPMLGQNDSLNVSNTVAIVVFEALRQRRP